MATNKMRMPNVAIPLDNRDFLDTFFANESPCERDRQYADGGGGKGNRLRLKIFVQYSHNVIKFYSERPLFTVANECAFVLDLCSCIDAFQERLFQEEWERALADFARKYQKGQVGNKNKEELIRHLTIKRDKKLETLHMQRKERERLQTAELVDRQAKEMLELFKQARVVGRSLFVVLTQFFGLAKLHP